MSLTPSLHEGERVRDVKEILLLIFGWFLCGGNLLLSLIVPVLVIGGTLLFG